MAALSPAAFPLLVKDLRELAARRSTYIGRVVYAALLFGVFAFVLQEKISSAQRYGDFLILLGAGDALFRALVAVQWVGVQLFLPVVMAPALADEKERNTLGLLLLTTLRPRDIILGKYFSRLVPAVTVLLLSLPLFAVAYSLGGLSLADLGFGVTFLLITCLEVGALALMFSSLCSSSLQAVCFTYAGVAVLNWVLPALAEACRWSAVVKITWSLDDLADMDRFRHGAPFVFPLAVTFLGLIVARAALYRRGTATSGDLLTAVFGRLDRFLEAANRRAGGIYLVRPRPSLPDRDPIAWREVTRRALGNPHWMLRVMLIIEVPLVLLVASPWEWAADLAVFAVWALGAVLVTVKGANAVSEERTRKTLDVLLSTPVSGASLVSQKSRELPRIMLLVALPVFTIVAFKSFFILSAGGWFKSYYSEFSPFTHFAFHLVFLAGVVPFCYWLAFLVGLKVRSRRRAAVMALGGLATLAVLPLVLGVGWTVMEEAVWVGPPEEYHSPDVPWVVFLSPAFDLLLIEKDQARELPFHSAWSAVAICGLYGALAMFIRRVCLSGADRLLGRATAEKGRGDRVVRVR